MPHIRLFMQVAVGTGARTNAILDLTWDRVDFDRGTIRLNPVERVQTSKYRATVPMNDQLRAALARSQAVRLERMAGVPGVHNARALGTIAAVELGAGESAYLSALGPRLLRFFADRDLLLRPLGNTVYVMPPYCIGDADLDAIWDAIGEAAGFA